MGYQSIYNQLRASGFTQEGALAMLGNWDCESNCESIRVQGDFSPYRTVSKEYTANVNSGKIDKKTFMNDQKGYGLAQWTYWTRKGGLYDFCKQRGGSIGDEYLQVQYALAELKSDFPGLLKELQESHDLYGCTKDICYKFENPAVKNVDARYASANRIKNEIDLNGIGTAPVPEPTPEPSEPEIPGWATIPATEYWPPRVIDNGMSGDDVAVLQAVLKARGYNVNVIDGHFAKWLEDEVKAFQRSYSLDVDGIVGPQTWGKLLERG